MLIFHSEGKRLEGLLKLFSHEYLQAILTIQFCSIQGRESLLQVDNNILFIVRNARRRRVWCDITTTLSCSLRPQRHLRNHHLAASGVQSSLGAYQICVSAPLIVQYLLFLLSCFYHVALFALWELYCSCIYGEFSSARYEATERGGFCWRCHWDDQVTLNAYHLPRFIKMYLMVYTLLTQQIKSVDIGQVLQKSLWKTILGK